MGLPVHRSEQTGQTGLDRIQQNVRDLIAYVRSLDWLLRRSYVALTANTTTASATAADLLSTTLQTSRVNSYLMIAFTASGIKTTNTGTLTFQIVVDGTVYRGCAIGALVATSHWNASILVRVPVAQGLHTIKAQWLTTTDGARINAASTTEEHAAMSVEEVA